MRWSPNSKVRSARWECGDLIVGPGLRMPCRIPAGGTWTVCPNPPEALDRVWGGPAHRRYSYVMRPLRYSINVTLDGCCDHRVGVVDEDLHRHATENIEQADALLFGRVTYEMMEAAWRTPARTGLRPDWMDDWMLPFARTIDAAKKYVVS